MDDTREASGGSHRDPTATDDSATVTLRYFASLREALGERETVALPANATVGALRDRLCTRSDRHAALLARGRAVRAAVNQQLARDDTVVPAGAEVAFFPPVTGG